MVLFLTRGTEKSSHIKDSTGINPSSIRRRHECEENPLPTVLCRRAALQCGCPAIGDNAGRTGMRAVGAWGRGQCCRHAGASVSPMRGCLPVGAGEKTHAHRGSRGCCRNRQACAFLSREVRLGGSEEGSKQLLEQSDECWRSESRSPLFTLICRTYLALLR